MKRLSDADIASALQELPAWTVHEAKLHRKYVFPDFAHAMGFLALATPKIEKMDHHPEWSGVYNRINVDLTTHSAGGITQRDVDLAKLLESIAAKLL